MTRILSALVILPIVLGAVVWLPPWGTLILASTVLLITLQEYSALAFRDEPRQVSQVIVSLAALMAMAGLGVRGVPVEVPLLSIAVVMGAVVVGLGHAEDDVVRRMGVAVLPVLYIGLPIGAMVAVRDRWGPFALLALLFTVIASDTGQYYGGRAFGRRRLAASISPKKTVEGALCGFVAGAIALPLMGQWWLPGQTALPLALLGVTLVALGITGDLLESLLKRSAGVKDASQLIPGHGGMLDRIDSLLLAAPVYYVFLKYAQ